jgi:hypothetical protein
MKTRINTIPSSQAAIVTLATKALTGAQTIGPGVGLLHQTAAVIAPDVYDYIGDPGAGEPGSPPAIGKRGLYADAKAEATAALVASKVPEENGRKLCAKSIGLLKNTLGFTWNPAWTAAGFTMGSLRVPKNSIPLLIELRAYFRSNPARESAEQGVTAAALDASITQIQAAQATVMAKRAARTLAKEVSDASFDQLRRRLSLLRGELEGILSDDDGRWYQFGFKRPADGRMPEPVTDLVVAPYGPGTISAAWGLSSLAENYRVSWRLSGSAAEPTEVGLFTDRQCLITALPSGQGVIVGVTARNVSGETAPTEAAITVP